MHRLQVEPQIVNALALEKAGRTGEQHCVRVVQVPDVLPHVLLDRTLVRASAALEAPRTVRAAKDDDQSPMVCLFELDLLSTPGDTFDRCWGGRERSALDCFCLDR